MSSNIEKIYERHIKPLPREEQRLLLDVLRKELDDDSNGVKKRSILELRGLGQEIWKGVDPQEYVRTLREEWEEPQ
ncbi:MAG TPA: hypothetical protein VN643_21300 [Pyrinomonadaceae bacterium]|nr:hypothetical protein [Pyrinomonadaceae bacterium]